MKFIHMADMHFDAPFVVLNKNGLGEERRLEQREVFKNIIEYIKENKIECLFICGDLYEQEYIRKTTIEYINNLFKTIQNTKIFIIPGNHDPLIQNSYYNKFQWNSNVTIFNSNVKKIELNEKIDLYGFGFEDFYLKIDTLNTIEIENENKINILLTHGSVDGGNDEKMEYNPMSKKDLRESEFNYIALGHIHKRSDIDKFVYPGSTIALGFDELGEHGIIEGEILEDTQEIKTKFIRMDEREFIEHEFKINEIISKEELIEKINTINIEKNKYYKILLTGERNFEINLNEINKYIENKNILKIKDFTKIKQDIYKISEENTLKGIFVRNMLKKMEENPEEKEIILKAIEIGIEAM